MLPLWRDQVRIVVCPDRLVVIRLGRGIQRRLLAKQIVTFDAVGNDWRPVVNTLQQVLRQPAWQKADAAVILSSQFTSYQLLPASGAALDQAERQALARHLFAQAYGDAGASFDLRVSEGGFNAAALASGVERELLVALRETFAKSSLRLVSVQPALMSAFNAWRRTWGQRTQWFALVESGVLCAALLHGGAWQVLRVRRVAGDWRRELELTLQRETVSHAQAKDAKVVSLFLPDQPQAELPSAADWSFRRLQPRSVPGFSASGDGAYAMALAGAL